MKTYVVDSSCEYTINKSVLMGTLKSLGAKHVRLNRNGFVTFRMSDLAQIDSALAYPALTWPYKG